MNKPIRRALVLSGGGAKGAYQAGVLQRWMREERRDYDLMCGVSVGALNILKVAAIPLGNPVCVADKLCEVWNNIDDTSIFRKWKYFGRYAALLRGKRSIYDATPLIELIKSEFDHEKILASGRQIRVGSVCINTGEQYFADETHPNLDDWALASASYPIFMEPVEIDGKSWIDGGVKVVTPIDEALRWGADEIDVILANSNDHRPHWMSTHKLAAIPSMAIRCIDLMIDRIAIADLRTAGLMNDLVMMVDKYREVRIRIQRPSTHLIDNPLSFSNDDVKRMMRIGYEDACRRDD
jgi:NTE family protein